MIEITIKANTISELKDNLVKVWTELDVKNSPVVEPEKLTDEERASLFRGQPQPTGSVDQDLAQVSTGFVADRPLKTDDATTVTTPPKRHRRTKAEIEAEKAKSDLADGPANSRPVTAVDQVIQQEAEKMMTTIPFQNETVAEVPKSQDRPTVSSGDVISVDDFKANFTQNIFLMLQKGTINSNYIEEKMKYYNLKDLTTMPKHEGMVEHFYDALRVEGKI